MTAELCAYCELPATTHDPFGDVPCCRVDFELLAGALDFDHEPTVDELMLTLLRPSFTTDEHGAWLRELDSRYGGWR